LAGFLEQGAGQAGGPALNTFRQSPTGLMVIVPLKH
jgi:hypothetical protein